MLALSPWIVSWDSCTVGGSGLKSCTDFLLDGGPTDYGSAIEEIEYYARCESDEPVDESMKELYQRFLTARRTLPFIRFYRKRRRFVVSYPSRLHWHHSRGCQRFGSAPLAPDDFQTLCREMTSALSMLALRLKPGDDFDLDGLLAQVNRRVAEFDAPPEPLASS